MSYIFNSLGSNYSKKQIQLSARSLFVSPKFAKDSFIEVYDKLSKVFSGTIIFTYKGRHALSLGMESVDLKPGDKLGLQGFTCWAVEEAIHAAGCQPIFIDVDKRQVNLTLAQIQNIYKKHPDLRAIIIQHTFGYHADIEAISTWAKEHNVFIIEDLAHAFGATSSEGNPLGTYGDVTCLSFGRDKIIDGVTGGACIAENVTLPDKTIPNGIVRRDLLYPFITWLIRSTYPFIIGKAIHFLSRNLGLLVSPIANSAPTPTSYPQQLAPILRESFLNHQKLLQHRRKIAKIYHQSLNDTVLIKGLNVKASTNLRYPILVADRQKLVKKLQNNNIYVSDTWFKHVVEMGRLSKNSIYKKGMCPNAEYVSDHVFNLPTHRHITEEVAHKIVNIINGNI